MVAPTRETAFDVLRGVCIISMVISHIGGRYLEAITHWPKWIDGSMGFVLISGLVLGLVQQRIVARSGLSRARSKAWHRAALVYSAHVVITLVALVVYELVRRPAGYEGIEEHGGWALAIVRTFTLQAQLQWLNILSFYAIVLLLVPIATGLLIRGRGLVLAASSAAVYALSYLRPDATMPAVLEDSWAELNWGAWQGLFFTGFLAGWHWQHHQLGTQIQRPYIFVPAAALALACFVVSRVAIATTHPGSPPRVFAKWDLGPGAIVWSCSILIIGYWLVQRFARWRFTAAASWALAMLGRRSLDAFVILGLAVILIPALSETNPVGQIGDRHTAVVLLAVAACAALRERKTLAGVFAERRPPTIFDHRSSVAAADVVAENSLVIHRPSK